MMTTPACIRMPTFFLPHGGGPCFFMDWSPRGTWTRLRIFLEGLAKTMPERPKAIVVVSAHWLAQTFTVGATATPGMIFDYFGFPDHTYALRFDAPGQPVLAARVVDRLRNVDLAAASDPDRGFDHGVFIPLLIAFPEADIPVVTLSLRADLDPEAHRLAGSALKGLRDDGVLIVGSGMSFHNMQGYNNPAFRLPSERFDTWLTTAVEQHDPEAHAHALATWTQAPDAELCHPRGKSEHLIPLMVAAGAAGDGLGRRVFNDELMDVRISAYRFD
jgi:aromatic ring-opening dioxygenase catalytic subunit (LigB family)